MWYGFSAAGSFTASRPEQFAKVKIHAGASSMIMVITRKVPILLTLPMPILQ